MAGEGALPAGITTHHNQQQKQCNAHQTHIKGSHQSNLILKQERIQNDNMNSTV